MAHSAHSLPELSGDRISYGKPTSGRPASVDLLLDDPMEERTELKVHSKESFFESSTYLTIYIVKGPGGFGFTIAGSPSGQKVNPLNLPKLKMAASS